MTDGSDPERLIADRYRLGPVIGRGGMATVYRAEDTRLDRTVALKLLRPEISADRDLSDRFRREALAATVLRHPNIVACLDTGSDPAGPFMVMDLIEGEDLAARIKRTGALPPADVARIGLDVARGLGVAHVRGIVHRDVKPGNVLLASGGRAMITDFGIARLAADAEAIQPGTTLGSVQYFSPEQAQGKPTTAATDVYGLGLVLYEALTGTRPWTGNDSNEIAMARVGAKAPSPRDVRPDVPLALDAIVTKALAPEPADRYPNGGAMAAALERVVSSPEPLALRPEVADPTVRVDTGASPVPPVDAASGPVGSMSQPMTPVVPATVAAAGSRLLRPAFFAGVAIVVAAIGFAAFPFADGDGGVAEVSTRPSTAPTAVATEVPTEEPPETGPPAATAEPVATDEPTGSVDPNAPPDLCEPVFNAACGLEPGRYAPAAFVPAVEFELGDGWSTTFNDRDIVALGRAEGLLTFASGIDPADRLPEDAFGDGGAADVVRGFAAIEGVGATKPATVRIGGHRGRSVDLTSGNERVAVFDVDDATFSLEPARTTRLVAIDTDDGTLILCIEPTDGHTLREILDTADDVAGSIEFR